VPSATPCTWSAPKPPPSRVLWVAAESDRFGYDIEVCDMDPPRILEVKGSSTAVRKFHLSAHELEVARAWSSRCVIHLWAEVDLTTKMGEEYRRIRALGYPIQSNPIQSKTWAPCISSTLTAY
jgi:hypothetical protein